MAESPYFLTGIEGLPVIIVCNHSGDKLRFKKNNAQTLSKSVFDKCIASGEWTQETNIPFVANTVNKELGDYEVWIQKKDAIKT